MIESILLGISVLISRYGKAGMFGALCVLITCVAQAGPIFPTRGFLVHPKWYGLTDTTSVFDHAGYWAEVQRGFDSDSDRWGWTITMGAIFEWARWGGNKSLFGITGMELIADTHSAISFHPRGAIWAEGLMYAVHESESFDWQAGMMYRCRHDIDNAEPGQYSSVGTQRTLIYCSLSGNAIWQAKPLISLPGQLWLHADAYIIREDYRIPTIDNGIGTTFTNLAWSIGPAFQLKLVEFGSSAIYAMANANFTAFSNTSGFFKRFGSITNITTDLHSELGYEFHGRAGRMQFYGGFESWQDDGQTPIPRNASYALLGVRVTGTDLVDF